MKSVFQKIFNAIGIREVNDATLCSFKSVEGNDVNPNYFIRRGDSYQREGNPVEAIRSYHKAADLMIRSGFFKKALAVLKIILRIDPADQAARHSMERILSEVVAAENNLHLSSADCGTRRDAPVDLRDADQETLFSAFTAKEIKEIFARVQTKEYTGGEIVIREGDSGDSIYVIKEGKARVVSFFTGRHIELAVLKSGDVFGEASFLTGRTRTASVMAVERMLAYEITRQDLEDIIERRAEIMEYLNEIYHVRVADTINKVKGEIGERTGSGLMFGGRS